MSKSVIAAVDMAPGRATPDVGPPQETMMPRLRGTWSNFSLVPAAALILGIPLTGCAHAQPVPIPDCATVAGYGAPFVAMDASSLVGEYHLLLRGGVPGQRPALVRGTLELWEPDSLVRHYDPRFEFTPPDSTGQRGTRIAGWTYRADAHVLHGAADVDWNRVGFYSGGRTTTSREPRAPGLRVEHDTLYVAPHPLGILVTHHAPLALRFRGVGRRGFWGDWHRPPTSGYVPDAGTTGQFCAIRIGA